jgi:hypothetical protein
MVVNTCKNFLNDQIKLLAKFWRWENYDRNGEKERKRRNVGLGVEDFIPAKQCKTNWTVEIKRQTSLHPMGIVVGEFSQNQNCASGTAPCVQGSKLLGAEPDENLF